MPARSSESSERNERAVEEVLVAEFDQGKSSNFSQHLDIQPSLSVYSNLLDLDFLLLTFLYVEKMRRIEKASS